MATNFEFYKDEISEITREGQRLAMVEGKLRSCVGLDCEDCDFGDGCIQKTFEWLYTEHIEQPKLTKRERAFCEAVQTGWIARDADGIIHWFSTEPFKSKDEWFYEGDRFVNFTNLELFFFVTWEDENPWSIEDLLKLEVIEEVQEDACN